MTQWLVADASPIISFARADRLALLREVCPHLYLPPKVFQEVALEEPDRPGAKAIQEGQWGQLYQDVDQAVAQQLPRAIHAGEREAIALACQLQLPLLADEKRVIRTARALGLEVVTSIRVLITAKHRGLIPAIRPTLDAMRTASFRISDSLYAEVLHAASEATDL